MRINIQFEFRIRIIREDRHVEHDQKVTGTEQMKYTSDNLCQQMASEIERQSSMKSPSTIDNYRTALRSFRLFLAGRPADTPFNAETVKRYERWLRSRDIVPNTISCYMRSLRALAVNACGSGARAYFSAVFTGQENTEKRAIQEQDVMRLRHLKLRPHTFISLVRDLFLFSFYALGMPFVDMAHLRKSQISEGQIVYFRQKTGQRVSVHVEPCMQEIIDRYRSESSDYVFPILRTGCQQEGEYRNMLNRYNRTLKTLAKRAGICRRLTSYVARHTWASLAYSANVEMPVISKALGHSSPQHTLIYIQQINDQRVNKANNFILREFL